MNAIATAHPNIALIKYWGDLNPDLHIPANGSISMNLDGLVTRTSVSFDQGLKQDQFTLNGQLAEPTTNRRVSNFLDQVRLRAGIDTFAAVESHNNFPISAGIASSAAGFAALSLAASRAAGLMLDEKDLSRLARMGSGSACRSVPAGYVEWQAGKNDNDSYAYSIALPNHWSLADCIAVVCDGEKPISSSMGHALATTSLLQAARVADAPHRLSLCREAILERDFDKLAEVVEVDSNLMHAVMMTSIPPLLYWLPATLAILHAVQAWRKEGIPVCYTIDAGPNVHVICLGDYAEKIMERLRQLAGVRQVLTAHPGGPATLDENL
jgi:diphosphomevalonate decarboxylase